MDKNEILAKSRKENKNQDVYEKEVMKDGWSFGAAVATILATVLFVIQILLGEGMNFCNLRCRVYCKSDTSEAQT